MSDILPKFKLYMLVSFVFMGFNIAMFLVSAINSNSFDIGLFCVSVGSSLVPFISFLSFNFSVSSLPIEISLLFGIITTILVVIQVFLAYMFVLQTVHNVIWNPDV